MWAYMHDLFVRGTLNFIGLCVCVNLYSQIRRKTFGCAAHALGPDLWNDAKQMHVWSFMLRDAAFEDA